MAAHILKLVYGSTTVNLYDGNDYTYLMGYELRGGGPGLTVTEQIRLQIHYAGDDAVNAAIRAKLQGIVAAAREALEWQESRGRRGTQTFLKIQAGGAGDTTYRSEVARIDHNISGDWLYGQWSQHVLDVVLTVTRRNFWEADSLTELSLSNGSGSGTGGIGIYNHDDGGVNHDNYVKVASTGATGSLPAPVKLSLHNTYNDADELTHLWVGQGTWNQPEDFDHIIEGEDSDFNVGGAADVADGGCSGGFYSPATWAVGTETLLYRWDDLSELYLGYAKAKRYRILARFFNAPGLVTVRAAITYPPVAVPTVELQTTGPTLLDAANLLYDLGELDIPPWLERLTSDWHGLALCLYGQIAGGTTVNLDFLHIQPVDSGRYYRPAAEGVEFGEYLIDDPDTGHIYVQDASGDRTGFFVPAGDALMLWPGRINRYYFLGRDAGGSDIARTATIQMWFRPRRQTL